MTFTVICFGKTITFSNSTYRFEKTNNGYRIIIKDNDINKESIINNWHWIDVWN